MFTSNGVTIILLGLHAPATESSALGRLWVQLFIIRLVTAASDFEPPNKRIFWLRKFLVRILSKPNPEDYISFTFPCRNLVYETTPKMFSKTKETERDGNFLHLVNKNTNNRY